MYDHKSIEKKWQDVWEKEQLYKTPENPDPAQKKYIADMFPYPSGAGLHVGHPEGYTATDIMARHHRMKGSHVLHPMGWDAFGLPAENYAIKTGIHPAKITAENINTFRRQIKSIGLSYDWPREVNTSDPAYYKWTQWLFLKFYEKGLAYKKEAYVNWCPKDQTVLANEQVRDGKCDRCGTQVVQKLLSQWFFKITDYAEELLNELEPLDWPEPIKQMQRNWISKSVGAQIKFVLADVPGQEDNKHFVEVFTTRPDTIFGATFLVISPELAQKWLSIGWQAPEAVKKYIEDSLKKTELTRISDDKDKTGVDAEIYAINPATSEKIPVWIADYVLGTYGTGAIMAVPGHDERDLIFAEKHHLFVKHIIDPNDDYNTNEYHPIFAYRDEENDPDPKLTSLKHNYEGVRKGEQRMFAYTGEGTLINSGEFTGMPSSEAREKMILAFGHEKIQYKLRDWLISRQRYWGAPIPIIYCEKCGMQPVPEKDLPVELPTDVDFLPTGESPLVRSKTFHDVKCPSCSGPARRDSDTMDTFVDSSWYYLRFADPHNDKEFASKDAMQKWLPVDTYVGGAEHAVLHLLYSRFFTKVLHQLGYISFTEPFKQLRNQGLVLAPGGEKMSKSKGNVINPDDVIEQWGADSLRLFEMFMGPLEDAIPWDTKGIVGVARFLDRVAKLEASDISDNKDVHKLIKKVTHDIHNFKFNTSIAAFMEYLNSHKQLSKNDLETYLKLLAPFAPHLMEELWHQSGHKDSIHTQAWPEYDENLVKEDKVEFVIQVNGKTKGTITAPSGLDGKQMREYVDNSELFAKLDLKNKEILKVIFVPDRLVNFVVK